MWRGDGAEIRARGGRSGTVQWGVRSAGEGGDKGRTARGRCSALFRLTEYKSCVCQAALVPSEWFAWRERKQFVSSSEMKIVHIVYPKMSSCFSSHTVHIPVREDPGLVGLSDDEDDSCLKNSLGFMDRCDTNAAASYRPINVGSQEVSISNY